MAGPPPESRHRYNKETFLLQKVLSLLRSTLNISLCLQQMTVHRVNPYSTNINPVEANNQLRSPPRVVRHTVAPTNINGTNYTDNTHSSSGNEFSTSPELLHFLRTASTTISPTGTGNIRHVVMTHRRCVIIARFPGTCWNCLLDIVPGMTILMCEDTSTPGKNSYRHYDCKDQFKELAEACVHFLLLTGNKTTSIGGSQSAMIPDAGGVIMESNCGLDVRYETLLSFSVLY